MSSLPDLPLTEVGRYARFSEAQERGLVAAAQDQAYWVVREGPDFRLYVESAAAPKIAEELARFEEERAERKAELKQSRRRLPKIETFSLFAAACVLSLFWAWQNVDPRLLQTGPSYNFRILHYGEWWRAVTALTLHSDLLPSGGEHRDRIALWGVCCAATRRRSGVAGHPARRSFGEYRQRLVLSVRNAWNDRRLDRSLCGSWTARGQ